MRRFSFVILFLLSASAFGQGFGRFGYQNKPTIPGFTVDQSGIVAKHPRADKLQFVTPSKTWLPVQIAADGETLLLDKRPGNPLKIRLHLTAPGISYFYPAGVRFKVDSIAAPYLTWLDGSVTKGVPSPASSWLVVSFRNDQPPIILGFPDAPAALEVTGKPGDWEISSSAEYTGWVRVGLPIGTQGVAANTASSLGKLAQIADQQQFIWTHRAPTVIDQQVTTDALSVTSTWIYDQPGALVPRAAVFAALGGYPVKIISPHQRLEAVTEDGPIEVIPGNELTIRFPIRRVPTGRSISQGAQPGDSIATAAFQDIPSIADLAMESMSSARDNQTSKCATDTLTEYLGQIAFHKEPITKQDLPYDEKGTGLDLAAAHALLMQTLLSTAKLKADPNSLLTSVTWRQDWNSWLPSVDDGNISRRASALVAIAGAMCPEPKLRVVAGMYQAGLSGERGYQIWKRRNGRLATELPLLEPELGVRQALFGIGGKRQDGADYGASILSPFRCFSDVPIIFENDVLRWPALEPKPSLLHLTAGFPLDIYPLSNLDSLITDTALGLFEVKYVPITAGMCEARIVLENPKSIPKAARPPRYSEPMVGPGLN
ncbi:hypothetical protein BH11ARM1_BH11ARM1_09040 [soil metagenome]